MAGIPISTIVKVAPGVLAAGGSLNALTGLVLSTNAAVVPVGTVKDFTTAADVGAAFGMESVEYQMACVYFAGYTNAALTPARLLFGGYAMAFFVWCSVAVPAWAVEEQCQAFGVNAQLPALTNPRLERGTTLLCNLGYAALVSTVSHGPLWAAEHLRANDLAAAADLPRKGHFYADPRWPGGAALSDYRRTKPYDRGHMAPSGDQPTLQAQQETYALSNIVPQASVLNKGIWARMEHKVRLLAERGRAGG
ncbi:DNA/RNA non-specific endonuclease [Acetobacter fabarum]|uniref:DNA/RNA non-specific endonuclease n=1 Tax=Acetobacter fabarum TaxID=483199 RepID=UPI0039E92649